MRFALVMRLPTIVSLSLVPMFLPASAWAVTQPNGVVVPQSTLACSNGEPIGLAASMACACLQPGVCNIGAPCPGGSTSCDNGQHGTCETTLWHSPNDNSCIPSNESGLNPQTAAQIVPETFHPTCGQTFTVISRGNALFHNVFGWYNATTNGPPDPSDFHVITQCGDNAGASTMVDVTTDSTYKGGDIAFFLLTPADRSNPAACASGTNCCPTVAMFQAGQGYAYYSQREFNPDSYNGTPYIHVLNLASTIKQDRFYFAWEDAWACSTSGTDEDFADLVTAVDGIQCSGAGQACNTGKLGVCALGVTECPAGSTTPGCTQLFQPSPDKCNGVDDDCDGMVDQGATCAEPGDVCDDGKCVPHCGSVEFPCQNGGTCDSASGLCVDPKCIGVTCPASQICSAGVCGTPCDGVVCPHGQSCVGNACIDLCAGVSCASGQVCVDGACIPGCGTCGGVTCTAPQSCDMASGACADTSCGSCPSGTYCSSGQCLPDCTGAKCPAGQTCQAGNCVGPGSVPVEGGLTPVGGPDASAGGGGGGGDGGANGDNGWIGNGRASGCACRGAGASGPPGEGGGGQGIPLLVLAALSLALVRRVCARDAAGRH